MSQLCHTYDLLRHGTIRVEVVCEFPVHNFMEWLAAMRRADAVPVASLLDAFSENNKDDPNDKRRSLGASADDLKPNHNPFRYNDVATLNLNFTTQPQPGVVEMSSLAPCYGFRRVSAFVHLVHGPSIPCSPAEASKRLQRLSHKLAAIAQCPVRYLVLSPTQEQAATLGSLSNVFIIPSHIEGKDATTLLQPMFEAFSRGVVLDVLAHYRRQYQHFEELPGNLYKRSLNMARCELATVLDTDDKMDKSTQRALLTARARKAQGDLCLMLGNYIDAIERYEAAISNTTDVLWRAAALESRAAAVWRLLKSDVHSQSVTFGLSDIVEDLTESVKLFEGTKINNLACAAEVLMQLSHCLADSGNRVEAMKMLNASFHSILKVPHEDGRQEVGNLYRNLARLALRYGWRRRATLFLHLSGKATPTTDASTRGALALGTSLTVLQHFGVCLHLDARSSTLRWRRVSRDVAFSQMTLSWSETFKLMLSELVSSAVRYVSQNPHNASGNVLVCQSCMFALTVCQLDWQDQSDILDTLSSYACSLGASAHQSGHVPSMCLVPFPIIQQITKKPWESSLELLPAPDPKAARFISNPYIVKTHFYEWVCGEAGVIVVTLSCPFLFPLDLRNLQLRLEQVSGSTRSAFCTSLSHPGVKVSPTETVSIQLTAVPNIGGVTLRVVGIEFEWTATSDLRHFVAFERPLTVDVLPAVSTLVVVPPTPESVTLFPGEYRKVSMMIRNVGATAIPRVEVQAHQPTCVLSSCKGCHKDVHIRFGDSEATCTQVGVEHDVVPSDERRLCLFVTASEGIESREEIEFRVTYGSDVISSLTTVKDRYYYSQRTSKCCVLAQVRSGLVLADTHLSTCARSLTTTIRNDAPYTTFIFDATHTIHGDSEVVATLSVGRADATGRIRAPWHAHERRGFLTVTLSSDLLGLVADGLDKVVVEASYENDLADKEEAIYNSREQHRHAVSWLAATFDERPVHLRVHNMSASSVSVSVHFAMPRMSPEAVATNVMWSGRSKFSVAPGEEVSSSVWVMFMTGGECSLLVELSGAHHKVVHATHFTIQDQK